MESFRNTNCHTKLYKRTVQNFQCVCNTFYRDPFYFLVLISVLLFGVFLRLIAANKLGGDFNWSNKIENKQLGFSHFNPISHRLLIPWVPWGESTPPMENPFRTLSPCFFYTQSNIHVSGPTMQKWRSLGSKLWNWQPIKNRTRRLEILKIRKIRIYTKKIETRLFPRAAEI